MGLLDSLFGGGTTTSTTAPDPKTQAWQDLWRKTLAGVGGQQLGIQGLTDYAGAGFSGGGMGLPDYDAVRKSIQTTADRQRGLAGDQADSYATQAGAYGGDRSALYKANAVNDVNTAEQGTMANLGLQQNSDQWNRLMQTLGLFGGAAQVGGSTTTQQNPMNIIGTLAGAGATGLGIYKAFQKPS